MIGINLNDYVKMEVHDLAMLGKLEGHLKKQNPVLGLPVLVSDSLGIFYQGWLISALFEYGSGRLENNLAVVVEKENQSRVLGSGDIKEFYAFKRY
ncbi:MAG TPA: hypothetical protein VI564_05740, partial [Candidatus Nanoarchaeia archaeon]|nr:hypothetical protein [Candidatus Nanoarchaeia archaeon]